MRFTALLLVKHQGLSLMLYVKITQPFHVIAVVAGGRATISSSSTQYKKPVDCTNSQVLLILLLFVLEYTFWKWWLWKLQFKVKIKKHWFILGKHYINTTQYLKFVSSFSCCRTNIIVHLNINFPTVDCNGYCNQ